MQALKNTFWNLLIVILCGVLAFLLYKRGKLDQYLPEKYVSTTFLLPGPIFSFNIAPQATEGAKPTTPDASAPKTATTTAAAPARAAAVKETEEEESEPTVSRSTSPAVEPAAAAQTAQAPSAAQPQPIVLSALAPRHIPREVRLLRPTVFPVVFNGRAAGTFSAPAGTPVKIVRINNDKLIVQSGDAQKEILASETDIYQRVEALMNR